MASRRSWRVFGAGRRTVVAVLAKPTWFWRFPDPWTGTILADADLEFVETYYLRPVIVLVVGSLAVVFTRLCVLARREPIESTDAPTLTRWMAGVTIAATTACTVGMALVSWRPDWFWGIGQPWLAWLVSGGLALLAVATSIGWMPERNFMRPVFSCSVLVGACLFFWYAPDDQFAVPLDPFIRVISILPAITLAAAHAIVFFIVRTRQWNNAATPTWLLPALLVPMAALLFVRSNAFHPQTGVVRAVVCIDAASGEVRWTTPVFVLPGEKKHAFNSHATPTPAADSERVYAYFGGGLAALDHDGKILWINRDPDYHRYVRYGAGSSLTLAGESLIVFRDSEFMGHGSHLEDDATQQEGRRLSALIAIDKKTGQERWKREPVFSHDSYMTPLVWEHDGSLEVVIATWKTLAGFDLHDGSFRWKMDYPMQQIVPSLAVHNDTLFVTGGNILPSPLVCFRPPTGGDHGKLVWAHRKGGRQHDIARLHRRPALQHVAPRHPYVPRCRDRRTALGQTTGRTLPRFALRGGWQGLRGRSGRQPVRRRGNEGIRAACKVSIGRDLRLNAGALGWQHLHAHVRAFVARRFEEIIPDRVSVWLSTK